LVVLSWTVARVFRRFLVSPAAPTQIYTLSLHDALPISQDVRRRSGACLLSAYRTWQPRLRSSLGCEYSTHAVHRAQRQKNEVVVDRKSTRLNSSHQIISYAVFCLKKKKYNL